MYGAMTKNTWIFKGWGELKIHPCIRREKYVRVDQLASITPGVFAQLKGILTNKNEKLPQYYWITSQI